MNENNSIQNLFKAGMTREQFLDKYAEIQTTDSSDGLSLFKSEALIGEVFDTVNADGNETLDDAEIIALAALDDTDGENQLSEADLKKLYEKLSDKISDEVKIDTPENMYNKNVQNGDGDLDNYLKNLVNQIEMLESMISLRQANSDSIIESYEAQIDKLMDELGGDNKKEYREAASKRNKLQKDISNIDKQIKQKQSELSSIKEETDLINSEIAGLDPDKDAEKIEKKKSELSHLSQKVQSLNDDYTNLQIKRTNCSNQLETINNSISAMVKKASENSEKLKTETRLLESKIQQERISAKTEINGYHTQLQSLENAKTYALDKIQPAPNDMDAVDGDYSDDDTSNYSYDAKALKQKWGKKYSWLSDGFFNKATEVSKRIGCDPNVLLGIMVSESGLKPTAYNKHGGATGLIQFMPSTARALGTSTEALRKMSAEQQLTYVEKHFESVKKMAGFKKGDKLDAGTMYTLVFLPAYAKRDVLAVKGHKYYNCNAGLDANKDGKITKQELGARVRKFIPA